MLVMLPMMPDTNPKDLTRLEPVARRIKLKLAYAGLCDVELLLNQHDDVGRVDVRRQREPNFADR